VRGINNDENLEASVSETLPESLKPAAGSGFTIFKVLTFR
jgi:hypothetical protein